MHRRSILLFAASTIVLGKKAYSADTWVEGQHYYPVPAPQRTTTTPASKVEVTEAFSYACPACDSFEPVMGRLKASLPANVQIAYLPASFNQHENWPMFQRAFYAAQTLGLVEKTHQAMYDAIWKDGELAVVDFQTRRLKNPMPTIEDAAQFYARVGGVKADKFIATAKSFAVDTSMQRADALMRSYQVDRTPTIIVNGKYRLHAQSAGGYEQLIELVGWLVAKESKEGKESKAKS